MKNILTLAAMFIFVFGFSQTKNDTIDFKKVNYGLLNQLLFEKCNQEREKIGSQTLTTNEVCKSAAQYQVDYMSNFLITTHYNDKSFRGVQLYKPRDRFEYFNTQLKSNSTYHGEICFNAILNLDEKFTYDQLAQRVINGFMGSHSHKAIMTNTTVYESTQFGAFASTANISGGYFNFYVTGVFGYVWK